MVPKHVVLKLFDRPVDLAQFIAKPEQQEAPLYPTCRAWIRGHRTTQTRNLTRQIRLETTNGGPSVTNESSEPDEESYQLPPPKSKKEAAAQYDKVIDDENIDIRIPESVRHFKRSDNVEDTFDKSINSLNQHQCAESNKLRWKKVRSEWTEARRVHEARYEKSFKMIEDLFVSQQRTV